MTGGPPTVRRAVQRRAALLALSSPLLIAMGVLAVLHRSGSDRIQALPALLIGGGLLATSWLRRRKRRGELLRALRQERQPAPALPPQADGPPPRVDSPPSAPGASR